MSGRSETQAPATGWRATRRWGSIPLAAVSALALSACRRLGGEGGLLPEAGRLGTDPGGELGLEVEALDRFLAGAGAVGGIALFLLLASVAFGLRWLNAWLRRRGLDREGRTTRIITLSQLGFYLLVGYLVFLRLVHLAPVLSTLMLLVVTTLVLAGNLAAIQNLISGAGMALRGWVTPGLHVRVGEVEGLIERTGPLSVGIRATDGSFILVPNRRFSTEAFALRHASRTAQVSIKYPWPRPLRPADMEAARNLVLLCPYHQADLDVATQPEGPEDRILSLTFHTSSEELAELARSWIYLALDEHTAAPSDAQARRPHTRP